MVRPIPGRGNGSRLLNNSDLRSHVYNDAAESAEIPTTDGVRSWTGRAVQHFQINDLVRCSFEVCRESSGSLLRQHYPRPTNDRSPLLLTRLCSVTLKGREKVTSCRSSTVIVNFEWYLVFRWSDYGECFKEMPTVTSSGWNLVFELPEVNNLRGGCVPSHVHSFCRLSVFPVLPSTTNKTSQVHLASTFCTPQPWPERRIPQHA